MASAEGESVQATVPPTPEVQEKVEETKEAPVAPAEEAPKEEKPKREPLTPEQRAQKKAERAAKRKEQRKAAIQAAKEAKARGEPPKPKAPKAEKAAPADLTPPEGGAPKISVTKLPASATVAQLKEAFGQYGVILRAEVSKRKGRPSIGTVVFNQHNEVKRAAKALNGVYKFPGSDAAISIQYAKDSATLGEAVKKATDGVADTIRKFEYKPGVLRRKEAKDLINRMVLGRAKAPATEVLTAALLVLTKAATVDDLVKAKVVESPAAVNQLLKDFEAAAAAPKPQPAPKAGKAQEEPKKAKLDRTFDAVLPFLDKLEKDRWNRMAKANLRLPEHHRFRFVDILSTPSLELWRWMVEDCKVTPAEAGTCFTILQNYYGFQK